MRLVLISFLVINFGGTFQRSDFAGMWILIGQISIYGDLYSVGVPKKIVITQKKDMFIINRIAIDAYGHDIYQLDTLYFNGKEFESLTKIGDGNKKSDFKKIPWWELF